MTILPSADSSDAEFYVFGVLVSVVGLFSIFVNAVILFLFKK